MHSPPSPQVAGEQSWGQIPLQHSTYIQCHTNLTPLSDHITFLDQINGNFLSLSLVQLQNQPHSMEGQLVHVDIIAWVTTSLLSIDHTNLPDDQRIVDQVVGVQSDGRSG